MSSYTECICSYFGDLNLRDGYAGVLDGGLVSPEEARLVREFHAAADSYAPPGGEHDHEAILADPRWHSVVSSAQRSWVALQSAISDPSEVTLIQSLNGGSWRACPTGPSAA